MRGPRAVRLSLLRVFLVLAVFSSAFSSLGGVLPPPEGGWASTIRGSGGPENESKPGRAVRYAASFAADFSRGAAVDGAAATLRADESAAKSSSTASEVDHPEARALWDDFPDRDPNRKLLLVVELCRHGDRAPISEFPNDVLSASKWPEGMGELTSVGERAQYELGQQLRKRYVDTGFLNPSFNVRDVYVRSTTIDRTLMSAYSQMAGLFPPGSASQYDVGTQFGRDVLPANETGLPRRWQPVPIHSEAVTTDALLIPGSNCPRFASLRGNMLSSNTFRERAEAEKPLLQSLAKIVGQEKVTLKEVWAINDVWTCNEAHGVPLPPGASSSIRERVFNISNWLLLEGNKGLEIQRLASGLLLSEIKIRMELSKLNLQDPMKARKYGVSPKKFVLYSAHDSTVAVALSALGIDYSENPPYNSTLIWELTRDVGSGEFYVQVEYNRETRRIPGCGSSKAGDTSCTLKDYIEATKRVTIPGSDFRERECLTGLRRHLATLTSLFSKSHGDILDGGTQQPPSHATYESGATSVLAYIIIAIFGCIAGGLAAKAKSSFDGYKLTRSEDSREDETASSVRQYANRSERGILL